MAKNQESADVVPCGYTFVTVTVELRDDFDFLNLK
jgi:hypothetical protein